MLEPRRLATRAAARRMADTTRTTVGALVGYQTRDERHIGADTRVEVVTEGVLTRRLQNDPELPGVGLVIFDEVHERNLTTDLGLALALDVASTIRPDLRLLAMSATPDVEGLTALLDAPVVESEGRMFDIEMHWMPRSPASGGRRSGPRRGSRPPRPGSGGGNRIEPDVVAAVQRALPRADRGCTGVPARYRRDPAQRVDAARRRRQRRRRVPARGSVVARRTGPGARTVATRASPCRVVDRHRRDLADRRRRTGGRRQRPRPRTTLRCPQRDDSAGHGVDEPGLGRAASGACRSHRTGRCVSVVEQARARHSRQTSIARDLPGRPRRVRARTRRMGRWRRSALHRRSTRWAARAGTRAPHRPPRHRRRRIDHPAGAHDARPARTPPTRTNGRCRSIVVGVRDRHPGGGARHLPGPSR